MFIRHALLFMALHTRVSNTLFFSYTFSCCQFSTLVNGRGLMLLTGQRCVPQPWSSYTGCSVARSVRNKAPLLGDILTSNDLDFLCLTETYACLFDSDSFLQSITTSDGIFFSKALCY